MGAIRGPIAITHLRSAGSRKACRVRGGAEGFIGGILEKKVEPVGAREGFDYLMGLRDLVREETACSLPGVFIKFEVFMPLLRKAQSQGYVRDADAIFVESGLRSGFNVGVERSCLKGKRVFRNYPPAVAARAQITVAMNKRLEKGRTVKLGRWEDVRARLDAATDNYFVFPMGAAEKGSNPDPKAPKVMRPTSDHTRTGLNAATVMEELRHSLNTYKEVAWLLKQNYFMYVADVEDAFLLIPLAPWLWFFFLFRYYATDADRHETTAVHIAGDFGAAGMPGTFKRFFVDVVVQMARSALVLTVPMPVYVDDCGAIDESSERLNAEIPAFQDWLWKFCGVGFKRAKDRRAAIPQLMIGFVWDSRSLTRSLEETKLFAYLAVLEEAAGQRSLSLQQRQSLAGKMQRAIMTMPPMAACLLANVYAMLSGLIYPWQRRRTTRAERDDYALVHDLLELNLGRGYYSYAGFGTAPEILSDASKSKAYTGGGWVSRDGSYDFFRYGTSAARHPIDELEGDTVLRALQAKAVDWRGCQVPFGIDNSAFQLSAAKGRSKAPRLNLILRGVFTLQIKHNFILQTFWISTTDNFLADHLSRDREKDFLSEVLSSEFWSSDVTPKRAPDAARVVTMAARDPTGARNAARQVGREYRSNEAGDGPSRATVDPQQHSVPHSRACIWVGLPEPLVPSVEQALDHRLSESSMDSVNSALNHWKTTCKTYGWDHLIKTDDPDRGGKLVAFVWGLLKDNDLVYSSISNYIWGLASWQKLQHQADPRMGVMGWSDFMSAVEVLAAVPSEPRRAVPKDLIEKVLDALDEGSFADTQLAVFILLLFFSFSRSECPCPKNRSGGHTFDAAQHWTVCDVEIVTHEGRLCLRVRFKKVKADPRMQRPEARGNADWVYIGDVPGTCFSILTWWRRLLGHWGERREAAEPLFMSPSASVRPGGFQFDRPLDFKAVAFTYREAIGSFRAALKAVGGDDSLGLHGLRVEGYNHAKHSSGEELTVAHGGWTSSAHTRYERFGLSEVLGIPARMLGIEPVYVPAEPEAAGTRQVDRGPQQARTVDASPSVAAEPASRARHSLPPGYTRQRRSDSSSNFYFCSPGGSRCSTIANAWARYDAAVLATEMEPEAASPAPLLSELDRAAASPIPGSAAAVVDLGSIIPEAERPSTRRAPLQRYV